MRDILFQDGDIQVSNNDFVVGEADAQTTEHVLLFNRGELKEHPVIGGELTRMINGSVDPFWNSRIKENLRVCGVEVNNVRITGNKIELS